MLNLQNGMYKPVVISEREVDARIQHDCSSTRSVLLCCIDENGMIHSYCIFPPLEALHSHLVLNTVLRIVSTVSSTVPENPKPRPSTVLENLRT